jgi:hypothetical protein
MALCGQVMASVSHAAVTKYNLKKLRRHTERIRRHHELVTGNHGSGIRAALQSYSDFLSILESEEPSLLKSVRQLISLRFFNHIYSALVLIEAGLFSDAQGCERSALEAFAAFQLVSLCPEYAEQYEWEEFPKPVKVRLLLEQNGAADIATQLQDLYTSSSGVVHVTRRHERFNVAWTGEGSGQLKYGGAESKQDCEHMIRWLGTLMSWFLSLESERVSSRQDDS